MNRLHAPGFVLLAGMALFASSVCAQGKGNFESAPAVAGSELANSTLLSGASHSVAQPVQIENNFGRFVIDAKVGKFSVLGVNMLGVRASELQAIETLQKVQQDSAFTDALAKSASQIAGFAKAAVTEPGQTVENIGKGVGTVFGRLGYLAHSGANYVSDQASDLTSSDKKAKPQTKAAPQGEPEPPSFIGDPLGYNMARREWAKKLNIDPYTSNPVLRPLLNDAAAATFAGNFGVTATLGVVLIPIQYAYELDDTVRQSVWNKPAVDLEKENEAKLLDLGVAPRTVRELLRNKWFTPTLQTALVARLEVFGKMPGMEEVVTLAAATHGETRARFFLESLAMLANHHSKVERFSRLKMSQIVPIGVTANKSIVVAVAIDYGTWDKDTAAFMQRSTFNAPKKTLLVAGKLSPLAQSNISKAGWQISTGLRK
jgi:hypothetical protein